MKFDGILQDAVCKLSDFISEKEKTLDHVHYGCSWEVREDKIFHVCWETKTEWEI